MVLTHTATHTYSHPFPTVTLAYFLRYSSPKLNPFSTHVLSTDTISSGVDPATGRLHTTRLHLKKSRLPAAIFKMLPATVTGGAAPEKASYILETSVVDMREGWMRSESRNLNFTGVLSVIERQAYDVPRDHAAAEGATEVSTTFIYKSRLGEKLRSRMGGSAQQQPQTGASEEGGTGAATGGRWLGWVGGWGSKGIQRTIEKIASTKTQDQMGKSREGMRVVLERLRKTGVIGVMEMMRRERLAA